MRALQIAVDLIFAFGPYVLAAGLGGYIEAKYGQSVLKDYAAVKAELATLKAKV